MKKLIFFSLVFVTTTTFAQTTTDSIATPLGEFVLVTTEEMTESTGYIEETSTTADGGTAEFLEISSGARYAAPKAEVGSMLVVEMLPNPAHGVVQLNISGVVSGVTITVTDLLGQIVYSTTLAIDGERTAYLPSQTWASGTYIVSVSSSQNLFAERLIVQ